MTAARKPQGIGGARLWRAWLWRAWLIACCGLLAVSLLPLTSQAAVGDDTVALFNAATSTFYLRYTNTAGPADTSFTFGPAAAGWLPVAGDWNGDGIDTAGLYRPSTSTFFLRNTNSPGPATLTFVYGTAGAGWIPIAGDWDGDGTDTIGLYDPTTSTFYLRNLNSAGPASSAFTYGPAGAGWTPVAGDWDGDGIDTIGLYNAGTSTFFLRNTNRAGSADLVFGYAPPGAGRSPVAGDWDGDGIDTIGLYNPATGMFFLRNTNSAGPADVPPFVYGPAGAGWTPQAGNWDPGGPPVGRVPLTDIGGGLYLGRYAGGLYPDGSNVVPGGHASAGVVRANAVRPLDANGLPSPSGRYVLLSIGMSNTAQEFCCSAWTFMGQAASDPTVNNSTQVIVSGALAGGAGYAWDSPTDPDYDVVRDHRLASRGVTERQVQVVWLKVANPAPVLSLPAAQSDAFTLLTQLGNIVRAMRVRYPNLRLVFVSSRTYGGYATTSLNPEPYAFESGFSAKWLIEAQIDQMQTGRVDPRAGDLNFNTVAPWVAWGPYLWADGATPRSDGLVWLQTDFESDGTHPSQLGETKVANMLMTFFKTSPVTRCWFLVGGTCP